MSEHNKTRKLLISLFQSNSNPNQHRLSSFLQKFTYFFRKPKILKNKDVKVQLFPSTICEGIKEFYIHHNNPADIYNDIIDYMTRTTDTTYEYQRDQEQNEHSNVTAINFEQSSVEIGVKIYLSRQYNQRNAAHDDIDNRVYLVEINRIKGEYMEFCRIKQNIVSNVLNLYSGLPDSFYATDSCSDSNSNEQGNVTNVELDYTVYDHMIDDDESDEDMVWIEY